MAWANLNLGPVHTYPEIFVSSIFFYADTKISATRSVYESYTTVHTYRIRIRTSQRISQQSSRGKRLVLILWRQRIQKYTDTSIHTYTDTQRIQKFLLWIAYTEISGYSERIRRTRVDARCIRIKKIADAKISGYMWTGPKTLWPREKDVYHFEQTLQKNCLRLSSILRHSLSRLWEGGGGGIPINFG